MMIFLAASTHRGRNRIGKTTEIEPDALGAGPGQEIDVPTPQASHWH